MQAIAQGKKKFSEIANATGIPQPSANMYLGVLSDLDIVDRDVPVTEERPLKSKKGQYRIKDEFFQFWFKFIFPRRSELEMNRVDKVVEDIKQEMPDYLSFVYEKVAREIVMNNMDMLFNLEQLGRWWGKDAEIDIVGLSREKDAILFGEAKWSQKLVGTNIFEDLKNKPKKSCGRILKQNYSM